MQSATFLNQLLAYLMVALASSPTLIAQNHVDLIRVHHLQQVVHNPGSPRFQSTTVDVLLPIVVNDRTAILSGFITDQHAISKRDFDCPPLYAFMVKAGLNRKHTSRLSGTYLLLPKWAGDAHTQLDQGLQWGALALLKSEVNPHLFIKYGCYTNEEFYGRMIVPLAGLYFEHKKWVVNATLPINADVGFRVTTQSTIGARFDGINRSFTLSGVTNYVELINNELGLYGESDLGNINVRMSAGYSVARSFRSYEQGDDVRLAMPILKLNDRRKNLDMSSPNGMFVKLSLAYRIRT